MVPTWLKTLFPRRSSRTKKTPLTRPAARPGLVQLEDRSVPANISIADPAAIAEGNAGTQTLMFTVTADAAEAADITFKINTADITATAGSDYVALTDVTGTILAGETTTKVMVTINGDTLVELNETFTVTLSDLSAGNTFTDDTATGTITNDDQAKVSISSPSITEGGKLAFSVTIDNKVDADVMANRQTTDGTATAASNDYTAIANGSVTLFAANSNTPFTIEVSTTADSLVELNETMSVILSALTASGRDVVFTGGGASETGTGTITNDDSAAITIADADQAENSGTVFTATLTNPVDVDITIDLTPSKQAGDTATATSDFSTATQTITILAGQLSGSTTVGIVSDVTVELDETYTATLGNLNASGRSVTGNGETAIGTILNDDQAIITIGNPSVSEGGNLTFDVMISNPVDAAVTANRKTANGTATTANGDYTALADAGITLFAANSTTTKTINVVTTADTIVEANETISLILSALGASTRNVVFTGEVAMLTGTGTIANNDTTILTINSLTFSENSTPQTFTISSSNAVQGGFSVQFKSADGSATAGKDYTAAMGTATFAGTAGENETFNVTILSDSVVEADETFILSLFNVTNGNGIAASAFDLTDTGIGTMTSADTAQFQITANANATEGGPITFTITLTNEVEATTSVTLTTAGGTATNGTDYTDATGTVVTFDPFVTSKTFMVATTGDNTVEANETFNFSIGNVNDGGITGDVTIDGTQASRVGTITNDDSAQFKIQQTASANEGSPVSFEITLTNPVDIATSVQATTADGTILGFRARTSKGDYVGFANKVINFPANSTSQTVMVTTLDDVAVENNELFSVTLGGAVVGGRNVSIDLANDEGTGTIIDNDGASLMIDDVTRNEADGTMTFSVTLVGTVDDPFTVSFKALNGTATTGDNDFTLANGTLMFDGTDGQSKTITVTLNDDNKVELDETFTIELFSPTATVKVADKGLGTIANDDSATVSIAKASAAEGANVVFTATLTNPVDTNVTVKLTPATMGGDTATATTDYSTTPQTITILAGNLMGTANVSTVGDTIVEADETFTATIGDLAASGRDVTIAGATATGTITNDDSTALTVLDVTQNEAAGTMTFTVTLSNGVQGGFTVDFKTADASATIADNDYASSTGTLSFAGTAGESKTFTVTVNDDATVEANENFVVSLFNVVPGDAGVSAAKIVATDTAKGIITNDDSTALTIDDVTQNENAGTMTFTVTLSQAVQGGFKVDFKTADGSATTANSDYNSSTGTLTFAGTAGESKTFTVTVNGDVTVEADETFTTGLLNVAPTDPNVSAAKIAATDTATGTITNDDSAQFKISKTAAAAEGSPVVFTITLTNPVDVVTSVQVSTTDGSAKSPQDFTALSGFVVMFPAGTVSKTVSVTTKTDGMVEPNESFTATIGTLNNGGRPTVTISAADDTGTGTIASNDTAAFSIANVTAGEGNTLMFTVMLSSPVAVATSVTVSTADLTANDVVDYTGVTDMLVSFPAGTTSVPVMIATKQETIVEADETFKISLGNLNDGGLTGQVTISGPNGSATGTITNDDSTTLTITDVSQSEAAGTMTFTVTLGAEVQGGFTVDFKTTDGTATTGDADYVSSTGTLTFAGSPGESKTFTVTVNDDNKVELDQTFTVSLFNVVPAAGVSPAKIDATDTATGTIANDDSSQFSINAASAVIEGGMVTFTVSLTNPVDAPTSVTVTTADGTAKSVGAPAFDNDFVAKVASVVSFGATVTSVNVSVATNADNIVELDELFSIALGGLNDGGRAVTIDAANDTGAGTITNDDSAQVVINKTSSAIEGGPITFTVTLTNPIDVATTVEVTTADLSANAGVDYTALMGKLVSFAALDTSEDVTVLTTADLVVEAHETFAATLGNLNDGGRPTLTISGTDNVGTGTITNDDKATLITIANVTQNEDTGDLVFTVQLTADVQGGFNVDIMSKDGTATVAGNDYKFSMATLAFNGTAGETKMFSVPANADNMLEADETFTVHLSNLVPNDAKVSPADIDISSVGTGTITNDDSTTLTVADVSQAEGAGTMTFTVTLSNPVQGGLKVDFQTFDGTALLGDNDYLASSGTLTFAGTAGETQTFTVTVNEDFDVEPNEFFTAKLSNAVTLGAGVSAAKVDVSDTAAGNILSDDKAVIDLFASVDVEGNNLVYTITLSNKISKDVSVDFATLAGVGVRPAVSGADFTAVAKTVTFTAGTTKQTVLVPLTDDRRVEGSEQFDANITNIQADPSVISAFSFGKAQDTATITDNDTAVFAFTAAGGGALENNVAGVTATVQLAVNATGTGADGIDRPIAVRITNAGGSATNGVDYKNFTDPTDLTFAPGNFTTTAQNIGFDLVEDLNKEGDETILFNLSVLNDTTAGQAAIGATPVHTFAIQSDDEAVRTYDATVPGDYRFVNDGGGNVQLFLGATLLSTDAVGTQAILLNGTANTAQPVEGVESATVDYANGSPVPSGGITFNANGPAAGERFIVSGGNFASIVNTLTGGQAGTLTLAGTTTDTLTYQNVDAVEINAGSVGSLTIQLPAAASQAVLEDDGIADNGISQIRSANGTFATTKFVNPTGTLTVAGGANLNDTLAIGALPDNTSTLVVGSPAVRFAAITQNGAVGSNGTVSFFADNIAVLANLTAAGNVLLNATGTVGLGTTTIAGSTVTQAGGSSVNITAGNTATINGTGTTGTTILFNGKIDGPGSLSTVSQGDSIFVAEIGSTTPLANATFGSPINANGTTVAGGALNIAANNIAFNAAVSANNAPIVLTLTGGSATQTAPFSTPRLFLNGNGTFDLGNAGNQLTAVPLGAIGTFITMSGATTVTDVDGIQALPGELFANLTGGSINVRDKTDLVIRFLDADQTAPAIQIAGGGNVTLTTGSDLSIEDPRTGKLANIPTLKSLLNVGTGNVQVFVGVDRNDPGQSTTVRYLAEATAGSVTLGSPPTPTQNFVDRVGIGELENVAKDTFTIRPMRGTTLTIHGNSPIITDPLAFRPYDSLVPQFAGVGSTTLTPNGNGNGTFTFDNGFQPLIFTSIETLGGIQAEAFVVQTGPSKLTSSNNYAVRFQATISGTPITGSLTGNGIITNPFVVTPSVGGSTQFDSPQITFADVDGDTTPDLIIANGAGDAPIITIIRGGRVFSNARINISQLDPATDIIAQFFAFEETFRGGVSVRAADFDGDGRAEVAVSPGIGGGPRIIVYQIDTTSGNVFNNATIYRHKLANGTLSNPYNFFPYESSFRGGVNVAIGDLNGDGTPDIIAGAGFGGGPRVRVFDGATDPTLADGVTQNPASTIADFFAYDPGFRGGVFVDAGRFDADTIADLVTAPGPGGSAHIQVFQGRKNAQPFPVDGARGAEFRVPVASYFAFEDQPSLFNPQPARSGVGSVAFGASTDMLGGMRSILVTRPEGTVFEIVKFEPVDPSTPLSDNVIAVALLANRIRRTRDFQNTFAGVLNPNDPNSLPPSGLLQDGGSAAGSS